VRDPARGLSLNPRPSVESWFSVPGFVYWVSVSDRIQGRGVENMHSAGTLRSTGGGEIKAVGVSNRGGSVRGA
jgi:hypothetical protein